MRSRSQIPKESPFLLSLADCQLYTRNFTDAVLNVSTADLNTYLLETEGSTLSAGVLMRDTGRSLTLFADNANGRSVKVALLREVQLVDGADTEGVGNTTAYLVPVWVDAPGAAVGMDLTLNVLVTRSG